MAGAGRFDFPPLPWILARGCHPDFSLDFLFNLISFSIRGITLRNYNTRLVVTFGNRH